ncbi:bone morphogenetic protein receptor type-2-like [Pholidichthys leucotaenia]
MQHKQSTDCDRVEDFCPDATCKGEFRLNRFLKCVCNTDFCNRNITWTPQYFAFGIMKTRVRSGGIFLVVILLLICLLIVVAAKRGVIFYNKKTALLPTHHGYSTLTASCQTSETSTIDFNQIELQQIVGQGHFATVYQGKYKGSVVAVKFLPAGFKQQFITEKEVYELPLMKHHRIVHCLGTGKRPDDSSCFIVLQSADCGSLHSFLCQHTTSWAPSLLLCQSLSEGLSYLHSDLRRKNVHKPPVAHGDLSSSSVLVRADSTCVLCDFGCSTILRSCSGLETTTYSEGTVQKGTLNYMSPEILEGSVNLRSMFLMQGDVYALSLVLWEIWMRCSDLFQGGTVPQHLLPYEQEVGFVTMENLIQHVYYNHQRPSIPENWELLPQGSALIGILTDCWDSDPDARLTAQTAENRLMSLQSSHL